MMVRRLPVTKGGVLLNSICDNSLSSNEKSDFNSTSIECAEQSGVYGAVAWLKTVRLANLLNKMQAIDFNKKNAISELEDLAKSVEDLIESNRGGDTGIHGFIGERAQVYLTNAWSIIKGNARVSVLIDDNGMTDYYENGMPIQQKACRSNGWLGLDHVLRHKEKYPDFAGKYQIPKDFYEVYNKIGNMSQKEAGRLSRHEWNLWKEIQELKKANIEIEPMTVKYDEIQRDTIFDTIDRNREEICEESNRQSQLVSEAHRPTIKECAKVTLASSAVEGVLTGSVKVIQKCAEGKSIKDFDREDLEDVGKATAEGSIKGAIRGTAVYVVENYTPIPGVFAGAGVTVAFDSAKAIKGYVDNDLTKQECVSTIEKSLVVATAGALGAKIGGDICPIPVVGEVVGGFVFSFIADKGFHLITDKIQMKAIGKPDLQAA